MEGEEMLTACDCLVYRRLEERELSIFPENREKASELGVILQKALGL